LCLIFGLLIIQLIKITDVKKILILAIALFLNVQFISSQVESVNYKLQYNSETCLFDCYLVVNGGVAKKTLHRAQFNAQITVVAPLVSNVYITESYMPLINNQDSRSTQPAQWFVSNEIESPHQLKESRLVSIFPELLPTAFYNEINPGDEVKLFSFKVTPTLDCAKDVRLYDNNEDPSSIGKGMAGSDFSNGFTMGGVEQKYAGNSTTVFPPKPVIEDVIFSMKNKINLDINMAPVTGSACQKDFTYTVVAPNGEHFDYKSFLASSTKELQRGDYKVIATDNLGCASEKSFNAFGATTGLESEVLAETTVFDSGVYPNPTQNTFALTMNGAIGTKVTGDIVNIEGKVVKSNVVDLSLTNNEEVININTNLTPGMYNLSLTVDSKETVNHKLLIIK
jgi:hypothetical protein